jgi:hypothetical protein
MSARRFFGKFAVVTGGNFSPRAKQPSMMWYTSLGTGSRVQKVRTKLPLRDAKGCAWLASIGLWPTEKTACDWAACWFLRPPSFFRAAEGRPDQQGPGTVETWATRRRRPLV